MPSDKMQLAFLNARLNIHLQPMLPVLRALYSAAGPIRFARLDLSEF
jgi:hypothetical protein